MATKKDDESNVAGNDDLGQSGTDKFPTYQGEKDAKGDVDLGAGEAKSSDPGKDRGGKDVAPAVVFDHGEESPKAKQEREALEENPPSATPVQALPENQDETVKPK